MTAMRITIIGATGMIGSEVTAEALRRGHTVIAASRHPAGSAPPGGIPAAVDADDGTAVAACLVTVDVAVLAVRPAPGDEDSLARWTRTALDQAAATDTRIIIVGGSGPLRRPDGTGLVVDDPRWVPEQYRAIALASTEQRRVCQDHDGSDWTYLSPPAQIAPGERTGRFVRGTDTLLVSTAGDSFISVADFAIAVVDEVEHPSRAAHITVASV